MSDFDMWDGKDVESPIVLGILQTGNLGLVSGDPKKLKTPNSDKPLRVSKKVPEGLYEIVKEVNGRAVAKKGDLVGIFPIDDKRLKRTQTALGAKADELQSLANNVKTTGGYGLVAYIMDGYNAPVTKSVSIRIIAGKDTIATNDS